MANTLAYTLHSIQDSFDHCDIGVAIPQFQTCDGAQLDSVNAVIVNAIQDIVDAFFWVEFASDDTHLGPPKNGLGVDSIILTATPSLISVELYIATWRSGTCRNHYTRTINIDVKDSRELRLGDIFKNRSSAALFFFKILRKGFESALGGGSSGTMASGHWPYVIFSITRFPQSGFGLHICSSLRWSARHRQNVSRHPFRCDPSVFN